MFIVRENERTIEKKSAQNWIQYASKIFSRSVRLKKSNWIGIYFIMISKKRHSKSVCMLLVFANASSSTDIRWPNSFIFTHSIRSFAFIICTRTVANIVIIFANEEKKTPQQWNWIVRCGKMMLINNNNSTLPTTISQQWCISNIKSAWSECAMRMHFDAYLNPTKTSMFLSIETHFVVNCTVAELLNSINLVDRICWFADFIQIKRIW